MFSLFISCTLVGFFYLIMRRPPRSTRTVTLFPNTTRCRSIALTKYIATQHGKDRIRCTAIAPGAIVTAHSRALAGPLFDLIEQHTPMRELGRPEDVAALVTFLASDEARYINGETIAIDGGVMAHHPHVKDLEALLASAVVPQ